MGSEALWLESGTGGRPPPLRAHGQAQTMSCREAPESCRPDPRSQPTSAPPHQAPSRDSSQDIDSAFYPFPDFRVAALLHGALSSLEQSRLRAE